MWSCAQGADCELVDTDAQAELVDIRAKPKTKQTIANCEVAVTFS